MAKNNKNQSKAVVGKGVSNKKPFKSFSKLSWQKKAYLLTAVGVLVLSIGYTGYGWWTTKAVKANAASGTNLNTIADGGRGGGSMITKIKFYGCKTAVSGAFGNLWKITITAEKSPANIAASVQYGYIRNNNWTTAVSSSAWYYGVVNRSSFYVSRDLNDTAFFGAGDAGGGGQARFSPSRLANC